MLLSYFVPCKLVVQCVYWRHGAALSTRESRQSQVGVPGLRQSSYMRRRFRDDKHAHFDNAFAR
jgi:hypothetical protein